jgi:hypothetical protein
MNKKIQLQKKRLTAFTGLFCIFLFLCLCLCLVVCLTTCLLLLGQGQMLAMSLDPNILFEKSLIEDFVSYYLGEGDIPDTGYLADDEHDDS